MFQFCTCLLIFLFAFSISCSSAVTFFLEFVTSSLALKIRFVILGTHRTSSNCCDEDSITGGSSRSGGCKAGGVNLDRETGLPPRRPARRHRWLPKLSLHSISKLITVTCSHQNSTFSVFSITTLSLCSNLLFCVTCKANNSKIFTTV